MAILSGNTDLLDKAKLEKKIASLEGERKSFNKGKRDSETKLQSKTSELGNNKASLKGMTEDYGKFMGKAKKDKDGNILNLITLDGVESTNLEVIGKHLQMLAEKETTGGQYKRIGEIYGFPVKIVSETSFENGLPFVDNRFCRGQLQVPVQLRSHCQVGPDSSGKQLSECLTEDTKLH